MDRYALRREDYGLSAMLSIWQSRDGGPIQDTCSAIRGLCHRLTEP